MRKRLISFGIIVLIVGMALPLYAGGIINKQNQSADYIRSLTRNATTDAADAVVYNPAGVMRMQNGFYVKADAIFLQKDYTNEVPGFGNMDSEELSIVPGLFALYKKDRWAAFFAVTVPGGGGKVEYDDGDARTVALGGNIINGSHGYYTGFNSQAMWAESVYTGYTLGGAFKVTDWFSVAGGVRYVDAYQKFNGNAVLNTYTGGTYKYKVDLERTDDAWNYFLGFDVAPNDRLNIGFLYMSNTKLNFESDVTQDNTPGGGATKALGWEDGTHEREDLPGYLALGVSYFIIPNKLRAETDLTYYLESGATFDADRFDGAGNSYDLAFSMEYIFNPQWKVSMGYMYTNIRGMSPDDLLTEAPELDANTVALGCVWSPLDRLSITLGGLKVWYDAKTKEDNDGRGIAGTELDKDVWGLSLGVQYHFL
jgi:long-chain fatty acid transport protein